MSLWFLLFAGVILLFAAVLVVGAPYVPTLRPQVDAALELLDLPSDSTLLELGCGDGKVLVAAAERGYQAVGIELNPVLFVVSWLRSRRYRSHVRVIWGDFWQIKWPDADGVFVFLLDPFMPKLDEKMKKYKKPLASVTFKIPGRKVVAHKSGVFLYRY